MMKNTTIYGDWAIATNDPISLFIDGMEITPAEETDGMGNFSLSYVVPTAWPVTGTHNIIANLSRSLSYVAKVFNAPKIFNVYTDSKITPDPTFFGGHYLQGDPVTITGKLTSKSVSTHNIAAQYVDLTAPGSFYSVMTNTNGTFNQPWTISSEDPFILFDYAGVPGDYWAASQVNRTIDTLQAGDVDIKNLTYPNSTFEQTPIEINGTLVFKSDGTPLPNRRMVVTIHNTSSEVTTDAQGKFIAHIVVPNGVTTRDINVTLLYANNTLSPVGTSIAGALHVASQFDPGNPMNPLPYGLIFGIVGAVVAVIVVFVLLRKGIIKLKQARPVYDINPMTLIGRVDALAAMGRIQESMAYLLVKYLDALRFRMQMTKKRGQTVRDIATEAVRRHLHQAEILYPWTSFVEAAVYSGRTVTINDLNQTKAYFNSAQLLVPFSEQELGAVKAAVEPPTPITQAGIQQIAPKNSQTATKTSKPSE